MLRFSFSIFFVSLRLCVHIMCFAVSECKFTNKTENRFYGFTYFNTLGPDFFALPGASYWGAKPALLTPDKTFVPVQCKSIDFYLLLSPNLRKLNLSIL